MPSSRQPIVFTAPNRIRIPRYKASCKTFYPDIISELACKMKYNSTLHGRVHSCPHFFLDYGLHIKSLERYELVAIVA